MSLYLGTTPIADGASTALLSSKADVDLSNVNASGTSLASGWSMPSSRYIDLTLGASGATYTAPANGWLFFSKGATAANQEVYIADINELFAWEDICPVAGQYCQLTIPWEKNHTYKVIYGLAGTTVAFRFIYAEGEN